MGTRAKGAALGAGLAVLALLALPSVPSLAGQTHSAGQQAKQAESGSTAKKSPQTKPTQAQTRPARRASPAKAAPAAPKGKAKPLVFTDEDLKKYHSGEDTGLRRSPAPTASQDPLKPFKDRAEKDRWRQTRVAEFQKNILNLEGRLKFLEQKRLSIQNPLLPRPTDPTAAPDTDEGLSGEERLARNDEEIRETTRKLEAARKELATFLEANPE